MDIQDIISSIEAEKQKAETQIHSNEGLLRLQEVARQYNGEYRLIWSDDLLEEIKNRPERPHYDTGIPEFDEILGGFRDQQLITVSASTKHGKTTMGLFLTSRMEALNPVVIALEQSNEEIVEQRYENGYSIPKFLSPAKLAAKVDTDWIEQRIIEGIAKHNTKFVLIDHLGYIDNNGPDGKYKRENLAYRIGEVMRELKNIAKRWNVVIVLLSHLSQKDEGKPPSLEDLKNSSDISQESDVIIMLWRKNSLKNKVRIYENKTMLSVLANRRTGRNGNIGLAFNTKTGEYESDNEWVKDMEDAARSEVDMENKF
jgi:replicative DNA helicase